MSEIDGSWHALPQQGPRTLAQVHDLVRRGEAEQAQSFLSSMIDAARSTGDWREQAQLALVAGDIALRHDTPDHAAQWYHDVRTLAESHAAHALAAQAVGRLGEAALIAGDLAAADTALAAARASLSPTEYPEEVARLLVALGQLSLQRHQYEEALRALNGAIQLAHTAKAPIHHCDALSALAGVYGDQDRFEEAVAHAQDALAIARELDDLPRMSVCTGNLGALYAETHCYLQAMAHYREASAIARRIGDRHNLHVWLGNLAMAQQHVGEPSQAMANIQEAISIARTVRDDRAVGSHLGTLGMLHARQGSYHLALAAYQEAIAIASRTGDMWAAARHQHHLALALIALDDLSAASAALQTAWQLVTASGYRQYERTVTVSLASVAFLQGAFAEAASQYRTAYQLARAAGDSRVIATALSGLANCYQAQDRPADAVRVYQRALTRYDATLDRANRCVVLNNLGECYRRLGRRQHRRARRQRYLTRAAHFYEAAARAAHDIGQSDIARAAWTNLGRLYRIDLNSPALAEQAYCSAIASLEQIRGSLPMPDQRIGFFSRSLDAYTGLALLYLGERRDADAWATFERARSRAFIDQLGETPIACHEPAPPALLSDERSATELLCSIDRAIPQASPEQLRALLTQRAEVSTQIDRLLDDIAASAPSYAALRRGDTLTYPEIQAILKEIEAEAAE